ncbi:type II secretion system protein [Rubellicoccus peritrichatus]|uniref:Prepilin-type N-terminal cleavage/methylation domain-containing protein n=1 Tax=Rubellicoccus peritrichatus TaxID=3080537 RepID=A0AAQ3L715_9BACT|nr:prepilin-type N-terminal cleavage/methylation domain-containing protein [Puniceicoccus sp. CR14]WOO40226.1 prepilin-type N-terminal cleavage/methylation domain-containing protein [Puniceicoccus sp. CR14]
MKATKSTHKSEGFTLVEIMIVVVIIGMLAIMVMPAFQKVRENSISTRVLNDFRIFSAAFERYALENGDFPPDGGLNQLPPGTDGYIPEDSWLNPPAKGQWLWDRNDHGIGAGVSYQRSNLSDEFMTLLDEKLDDGDITTGRFQKLNGDRCTLILEF